MAIRLVVFDIDGTILQNYSWQYIHQSLGTWKTAKGYADLFFENQITYEEWAKLDAALWKGQTLARITKIIKKMSYMKGAKETLATLKAKAIKIFLLSAGLSQVAQRIQKETETNGYAANRLVVRNGFLTGEVEVNVSFYDKDKLLPQILRKFNVTLGECAAVGDDLTLLPLFKKVALAIAFNPINETVERNAHITIRKKDLRNILPYLIETNET